MQRDMRRLSRLSVLLAVAALALVLAAVAVADKPAQPPGQAKKQQQVDPPAADAVPPGQAKPKKAQDVAPDDAVPADDAAPEPAAPAKPDKAAKRDDAASAPGAIALEAGAPELGERLGVTGLGEAKVKARGGHAWTDLSDRAGTVPDDAVVDARQGAVAVSVAVDDQGTQQAALFTGAIFTVHQPAKPGGVTELILHGGNFAVCDAPAADTATAAAVKRRSPVVRRLWGTGHGRFRTRGRYAAATVRGTTWTVEDRCHSTVTKVLEGIVAVRDLVTGALTNVHAGGRLRVAAP